MGPQLTQWVRFQDCSAVFRFSIPEIVMMGIDRRRGGVFDESVGY